MKPSINLYSTGKEDIKNFLSKFYDNFQITKNLKKWSLEYENPIEMVDLIGVLLDNKDKFNINMWISLDPGFYININDTNGEKIIRYLFERYPI